MNKFLWEDLKKTIRNYAAFGACIVLTCLFGVGALLCVVLGFMQIPEGAYLAMVSLWLGGALCAFVAYMSGVVALWIYDNLEGFV